MNEIETGGLHAVVGLLIIWIRISTCYANTILYSVFIKDPFIHEVKMCANLASEDDLPRSSLIK